jgi:hypothetical protein
MMTEAGMPSEADVWNERNVHRPAQVVGLFVRRETGDSARWNERDGGWKRLADLCSRGEVPAEGHRVLQSGGTKRSLQQRVYKGISR